MGTGHRALHLDIVDIARRVCPHKRVGSLTVSRKVVVLFQHRHQPQVHVLEEGVLVLAVGGNGEEARLLQVQVNLRRESVQYLLPGDLEVGQAQKRVDCVFNAHRARKLPGRRPQLHLVEIDLEVDLPVKRVGNVRSHNTR